MSYLSMVMALMLESDHRYQCGPRLSLQWLTVVLNYAAMWRYNLMVKSMGFGVRWCLSVSSNYNKITDGVAYITNIYFS